jgi:hypothetical protein
LEHLGLYELEELERAVLELMPDKLLLALTAANRTGELGELLRLLGMGELAGGDGLGTPRPARVLVVGESQVKEGKLRSIARKHGWDDGLFDFVLDYEAAKRFDFARLRDSAVYRAVLAGPMPHSVPGRRDASSAIAEIEGHPESYPPLVRLRDSNGLKITNNSFAKGLEELERAA